MKTSILDTQEAPNKWWAAQDARMRNLANKSHWSQADQVRAERMKQVLTLVYQGREFYIAYGKTGISIKVDQARVIDRRALALLEQDWAAEGVTKKDSTQGVIYRFK